MQLVVQSWVAMRDPAVWGEDAGEFKPDRMLDGRFESLPVCLSLGMKLFYRLRPYLAQCLATIWIRHESMHRKLKIQCERFLDVDSPTGSPLCMARNSAGYRIDSPEVRSFTCRSFVYVRAQTGTYHQAQRLIYQSRSSDWSTTNVTLLSLPLRVTPTPLPVIMRVASRGLAHTPTSILPHHRQWHAQEGSPPGNCYSHQRLALSR